LQQATAVNGGRSNVRQWRAEQSAQSRLTVLFVQRGRAMPGGAKKPAPAITACGILLK
jgi:hypothetical protein